MKSALLVVAALGWGTASSASAQYLMVPNFSSAGRSIMLFNKSDGSLVQQNWIVGDGGANVFNSPTEALAIGTDVWISDQVQNKIFRYDLTTGTFKAALTGSDTTALSNIRGMERVGNSVYVANAGTGFGNSIVQFDATTGAFVGSFATAQYGTGTNSPWDVQAYGGELLVSTYSSSGTTGTSHIDRYDLAGNYLGNIYDQANTVTTGIRGPQQITVEAGGNLLVGGFSGTTQSGVYEITGTGSQLNFWAGGLGPRAAFRLDDGNIMFTKGDGVWYVDPGTNTVTPIFSGSNVNAKYISEIGFIPAPGALSAFGMLGIAAARRRRG